MVAASACTNTQAHTPPHTQYQTSSSPTWASKRATPDLGQLCPTKKTFFFSFKRHRVSNNKRNHNHPLRVRKDCLSCFIWPHLFFYSFKKDWDFLFIEKYFRSVALNAITLVTDQNYTVHAGITHNLHSWIESLGYNAEKLGVSYTFNKFMIIIRKHWFIVDDLKEQFCTVKLINFQVSILKLFQKQYDPSTLEVTAVVPFKKKNKKKNLRRTDGISVLTIYVLLRQPNRNMPVWFSLKTDRKLKVAPLVWK